jgi:hypothetical protein
MLWFHCRLAAAGILLAAALGLCAAEAERRPSAPLRFTSGGRFKVSLFADLHYGENAWTDWGPAQDDGSDRVMATVLDAEKPGHRSLPRASVSAKFQLFSEALFLLQPFQPNSRSSLKFSLSVTELIADFVVYLGDLVTANNVAIPNATLYWDRALSPARRRGIPWATVFGNHDDMPFEWPSEWFSPAGVPPVHCPPAATMPDSRCSFRGTPRMELLTAEINRDGGLSRSSAGPEELWPGVSNYVLQVLSREKDQDPALLMYFLDSGGGSYPEVISAAQVGWFKSRSQFLNPDGRSNLFL